MNTTKELSSINCGFKLLAGIMTVFIVMYLLCVQLQPGTFLQEIISNKRTVLNISNSSSLMINYTVSTSMISSTALLTSTPSPSSAPSIPSNICIKNPLIFGISNYNGIEMTTNWLYSLWQNGFEGRILIIVTDFKAYEYFKSINYKIYTNKSTSLYLHCFECQNSGSWNNNFNKFVCYRPVITRWIIQQIRNKTHYLSQYDSLIYMDGDMVIMKSFTKWMENILSSRYCGNEMVIMDDTKGDRVITPHIRQQWQSGATINCQTYMYCSCFWLILNLHDATLKIDSFLRDWSNECNITDGTDQHALNKVLSKNKYQHKFEKFHCDEFPNGNRVENKYWLNQFDIYKDIYLLHANWRQRDVKKQWLIDRNVWFINATY